MASIIQIKGRWRAQVRRKGHPSYCETFPTKAAAEAWARKIEAQIDLGKAPRAADVMGRRYMVADAVADYRKLRMGTRPIADDSTEHYTLKHLAQHLGKIDAQALTVDDLVGYCRIRSEEGAGGYTCNMDVSKLGTVLRLVSGVKHLGLPDIVAQARPVLRHLGLIHGGGKRERRPTEDELHNIIQHLAQVRGQIYADVVRFATLTAMRRGEISRIVWEDVDADKRLILVRDRKDPRQKMGNDEWVPLLNGAWELVEAQPTREGRIFPVHEQTLSKYFTWACRDLGIPDLHFHDLRHDGVSRLFEQGYDIPEVAMVSGHKSWKNLKRYTQLRPESLHQGPRRGVDQSTPQRPERQQTGAYHQGKSGSQNDPQK